MDTIQGARAGVGTGLLQAAWGKTSAAKSMAPIRNRWEAGAGGFIVCMGLV
jgi:hypothetical protein